MDQFAAYVLWPQSHADDELLAAVNEAWPETDGAFCSSLEPEGVLLSFDIRASSYEEAAALASQRALVLAPVLSGKPMTVTVYTEEGSFERDLG